MSYAARVPTNAVVHTSDSSQVEFDDFANGYELALQNGLRVAGEKPEYFARRRIEWTRKLLIHQGAAITSVLDFGCGVGIATQFLQETFMPSCLWGFDPSAEAIARAKRDHPECANQFLDCACLLPEQGCDLVYTNGVFHHIPPQERTAALAEIWRTLRPGGFFAFWENNPWNPGTRLVMNRIPFDRDASTMSPPAAKLLLKSVGFTILRTDAWFLFPHALRVLRPLEWCFHRLPLGAQYLVLAQRPPTREHP